MSNCVIHISESDAAATDVATLLASVRAGEEIAIEKDKRPFAVLHPTGPRRRTLSVCIAGLPKDSTAAIDADFAKDVEVAVACHREPLNPPARDCSSNGAFYSVLSVRARTPGKS